MVRRMPATVLRLTPLNEEGKPTHPWAMTYRYDEPVLLCFGVAERTPSWLSARDTTLEAVPTTRALGALVGPLKHPELREVEALAHGLWQRRRGGAAVEAWAPRGPRMWAYSLIPFWRHHWDTDRWPLHELEDSHRVYAVGDVQPVDSYAMPTPPPFPATSFPGRRTQLVYAETETPPPPPGLAPLTGQPSG
ncbi:hypothetical protein QFZ66_005846 [Streptomyces sp. B4I13]|uniref:hypothetical protein n=1 Tax=Streptomyces sp. B4I13 TaxID=3042271 RepID=UPI0027820622|nr:hypothetical protein [Streptomyces sp. B4I13]MDQ0961968.1 hypothetical protein [Streptomyces sp. B4I13]